MSNELSRAIHDVGRRSDVKCGCLVAANFTESRHPLYSGDGLSEWTCSQRYVELYIAQDESTAASRSVIIGVSISVVIILMVIIITAIVCLR